MVSAPLENASTGSGIVAFAPYHLADIEPPLVLREPMRLFAIAYCPNGPALTFVERGQVMGAAGLAIDGPQAKAWAFLSPPLRNRPQGLHRSIKRTLPKLKRVYGLESVLAEAHPDHAPSRFWLDRLGFRFDGVGERCPILGERPLRYIYR